MTRIAFFGLGEMGYAMAGHLARACHLLTVYDLDAARVTQWQAEFGVVTASAPPEVLITSLTDADALSSLLSAPDGIAKFLSSGALWIDHTTASPPKARGCAALATEHGAAFVDAPMSGGRGGAVEGELTLFVGGDPRHLSRVRDITQAYCAHIAYMGPVGAGQAAKLAHQLALAGTVVGLNAALQYGAAQGLAAAEIMAALKHGTARSAQLSQHATKMGAADFDFAQSFAWLARDLAALPEDAPGLPGLLRGQLVGPRDDKS